MIRASTWSVVVAALIAAWLGAVVYFSAVVAPAAFRALPTRDLAGALVRETLPALFLGGIVVGALVVAAALRPTRHRAWWIAAGAGMVFLCAFAHYGVGRRINQLRSEMTASLDALQPGDPRRAAFGRLHAMSVASLGAAALLAAGILALALRNSGPGDNVQ